MDKISRRKALGLLGVVTAGNALFQSGCCCIREILNNPCTSMQLWKQDGSSWWRVRKKLRKIERKKEIKTGIRVDVQLPKPFLDIDREKGPHDHPIYQLRDFHLNEWKDIYVMIRNRGNAPALNCIVETYETPAIPYDMLFSEFTLNDRIIVTVMPGESKEVKLRFCVTKTRWGGLGWRIYDPICDPGILTFGQYDRHTSGCGWDEWTNG